MQLWLVSQLERLTREAVKQPAVPKVAGASRFPLPAFPLPAKKNGPFRGRPLMIVRRAESCYSRSIELPKL